jgi:N-acetyl-beta-hexosaminidase
MRVADAPRFTHRGIMLDLARRFWPADALLSVLDAMAVSKLNVLHLHITDAESFMFESLAFPQLNREAAFRQPSCTQPGRPAHLPPYGGGGEPCLYRQAMLRQLVAEATDRGIRVVPEFDMPGHAGSWGAAFPEIIINCTTCSAGGLSHILLDPFQDETWKIVGSVLEEAAAIFPDERLHLGGDEVCWRCYNESASVRAAILGAGRKLDDDGFKWVVRTFLARAQALVASHGRKTSVWNEAFGIYGPGNRGYAISNGDLPHRTYSINTELMPGTVVQDWWGGHGSWFGRNGRQCATNTTAALAHGMGYLNSEGWYLPIGPPPLGNCSNWAKGGNCGNWTGMYIIDPATNKTCSYPAVGPPNCTCFEHGNAGAGTGCYDIAPNAAGGSGEYTQLLGGEACLWGNSPAPPYNASAAFRHLWPGGLAVAERLWSARHVVDWRSAAPRLEAQMGRLEQRVLRAPGGHAAFGQQAVEGV